MLRPEKSGALNNSPLLSYVDRTALFSPKELLRLGTMYGGWMIPANSGLSAASVCYSAGAGEDISFDCALVQRFHCQVRVIDPTPRAIQHFKNLENAVRSGARFPVNNSDEDAYTITAQGLERLRFLPIGLAGYDAELKFYLPHNPDHVSCSTANLQKTENYFIAECFRLWSIMQQQGDDSIEMLKMDIEGAEYAVIKDMTATKLLPRLLLIEFDEVHMPLDDSAGMRIKQHIEMLTQAGMRCIAVEGSNATFLKETVSLPNVNCCHLEE
ncbi:MAG: FkbM family methyltransferase [Nitrospira sp.]